MKPFQLSKDSSFKYSLINILEFLSPPLKLTLRRILSKSNSIMNLKWSTVQLRSYTHLLLLKLLSSPAIARNPSVSNNIVIVLQMDKHAQKIAIVSVVSILTKMLKSENKPNNSSKTGIPQLSKPPSKVVIAGNQVARKNIVSATKTNSNAIPIVGAMAA